MWCSDGVWRWYCSSLNSLPRKVFVPSRFTCTVEPRLTNSAAGVYGMLSFGGSAALSIDSSAFT